MFTLAARERAFLVSVCDHFLNLFTVFAFPVQAPQFVCELYEKIIILCVFTCLLANNRVIYICLLQS